MTVTLHLGDCLEYMKSMPDKSVDAVITDPPYNVDFADWDNIPDFENWIKIHLAEFLRISERAAITPGLVNVGAWSSAAFPKWILCWLKEAAMKRSPFGFCNWDAVLFYGKSKITHGFTDVIKAPIIIEPYNHPSIKPVALMRGLIERTSNPNDTIFDPFMGSGTTGVAAVQLGRNFIGCEIDPKYFAIAEKRIHEATLQPQLFTEKKPEEKQEVLIG